LHIALIFDVESTNEKCLFAEGLAWQERGRGFTLASDNYLKISLEDGRDMILYMF
jgi:hypothetical protein